jgi:chitinase
VIRGGAGADIVLTTDQEQAYRCYVRRFVARMGGDGLQLFKYGGDR